MRRPPGSFARKPAEPTIALINIVFLMLVFFLIAGSIAPRPDRDIALVELSGITTEPPRDALVITAEGALRRDNRAISIDELLAEGTLPPVVRLLPDRNSPADTLVSIARALRAAGAERLVIVTQEAMQ